MNEILEKIKFGILDIFPDTAGMQISAEMLLGEIPDYDSMAAVNLQVFLEENFPLKISLDMLNEKMPLGELALYIARFVKS
jgi:acyl carrier protein